MDFPQHGEDFYFYGQALHYDKYLFLTAKLFESSLNTVKIIL
jgi:hypothetical protein